MVSNGLQEWVRLHLSLDAVTTIILCSTLGTNDVDLLLCRVPRLWSLLGQPSRWASRMSSLRRAETSNLDSAFALVEIHGEGLVHVILALCSLSMMVVARDQVVGGVARVVANKIRFHNRIFFILVCAHKSKFTRAKSK